MRLYKTSGVLLVCEDLHSPLSMAPVRAGECSSETRRRPGLGGVAGHSLQHKTAGDGSAKVRLRRVLSRKAARLRWSYRKLELATPPWCSTQIETPCYGFRQIGKTGLSGCSEFALTTSLLPQRSFNCHGTL